MISSQSWSPPESLFAEALRSRGKASSTPGTAGGVPSSLRSDQEREHFETMVEVVLRATFVLVEGA
jgi:hypothetical protein